MAIGHESSKPLRNKTQSRGRPTTNLPIEHKSTPDQHCMLPCHGVRTGTHGRQAPPLSLSERCQRLSALHVAAAAEHAPSIHLLETREPRCASPSAVGATKREQLHFADDHSAGILVRCPVLLPIPLRDLQPCPTVFPSRRPAPPMPMGRCGQGRSGPLATAQPLTSSSHRVKPHYFVHCVP